MSNYPEGSDGPNAPWNREIILIECPKCCGTGEYDLKVECDYCEGTGQVEKDYDDGE